jgi:hypothetical protein
MSAIDTAAKKNIVHKNKAARFKSRLARRLKEAGIKPLKATPAKTTVKKPASKKATDIKKTGGK